MQKKLLLTVSENKAFHNSVHFLGKFLDKREDITVTLFYTAPRPEGFGGTGWVEEDQLNQRLRETYLTKGRQALDEAEKELISYGFKGEQIQKRLIIRQLGKIADILQEAQKGLYDAILLGRRGLSFFDELLNSSVTRCMLDYPIDTPLWMCQGHVGKKSILVCYDGSAPSLRALEHIAFVFQDQPKHSMVIATVNDGKEKPAFEDAQKILEELTIPQERYQFKVLKGSRVLGVLLDEIKEGDYGMVVTGRSGRGRGLLEKIFMGSVSYGLYKSVKDRTLCIVR